MLLNIENMFLKQIRILYCVQDHKLKNEYLNCQNALFTNSSTHQFIKIKTSETGK